MSEVTVYNKAGEKIGTTKLVSNIFGVAVKPFLIHEAIVSMQSNARRSTAHTKTRGDVSGGGKKPWKQKGTGRARHGSIRSPIWKGGGVTFGPSNEKNYFKKVNDQVKKRVILMALSDKAVNNNIYIIEDIEMAKANSKTISKILSNFKMDKFTLLIHEKNNETVNTSCRNIKNLFANSSDNLHLFDVVKAKNIIITKKALSEIEAKKIKTTS